MIKLEGKVKFAMDVIEGQIVQHNSICLTSAFQPQSPVLLHLVSSINKEIPVIFLDTGYHFPETLLFKERLTEMLELNIVNVKTRIGHGAFKMTYGTLYATNPDLCCHINKTLPFSRTLDEYEAWITGVRADQSNSRKQLSTVNHLENGKVKICPMLDWTSRDIWKYMTEFKLPEHPLLIKGYMSVGCAPCTRCTIGEDDRSGRWADSKKVECGIHTNL